MSVINQMLKDLEKRARSSRNADLALPAMPVSVFFPYNKIVKKPWRIATFIFIVIIFFIISYPFIFTSQPSPKLLSTKAPTQSKVLPPPTKDNSMVGLLPLTPAIVTAITLQLQKETTSLHLLLSQEALYQVSLHHSNQLIILLENARLVASLPPINTMTSAIQDLKMFNQSNGNLKIILSLKPGVELTHLELNAAGKLPELQLDLISPPAFNATASNLTALNANTQEKITPIIRWRSDVSLSDQYQQALQLSAQGHSNAAMTALADILAKDTEYAAARVSLASLLITQGNMPKAEQVLKTGLQQRPFYPDYIQLKARILVSRGKVDQALHLLQLAPPTLSANPDYHAFIAALYQRQGQSIFAEKLYEQLLALQPNNATWWMGLGIALEGMGKKTLAMEAYLKAKNSDQLNPELKMYADTRVHNMV